MDIEKTRMDRREFFRWGGLKIAEASLVALGLLSSCNRANIANEGEQRAERLAAKLSKKGSEIIYIGAPIALMPGVGLREYPDDKSKAVYTVKSNSLFVSNGGVLVNEASVDDGDKWKACIMIIQGKRMRYFFVDDSTGSTVNYYDSATNGFVPFESVNFRSPSNIPLANVSVDQPITYRFGGGGEIDQYPTFINKETGRTTRFGEAFMSSANMLDYKSKEDILRQLSR